MLPPEPVLTPTGAVFESMSWWKTGMVSLVEHQIEEVLLPPLFPFLKLLSRSTSSVLKISERI